MATIEAVSAWQAAKKKSRKSRSVAVVVLTASTMINHDCVHQWNRAWKSCCTHNVQLVRSIPVTVPERGVDFPIIASGVVFFFLSGFVVQQKGDSF